MDETHVSESTASLLFDPLFLLFLSLSLLIGCSDPATAPRVISEGTLEPMGNSDLWVAGHKLRGPSVSYALVEHELIFDEVAAADYFSGVETKPPMGWVERQARDLIGYLGFWFDAEPPLPEDALLLATRHGDLMGLTGEYRSEAQAQIDHVLAGKPISELPAGPLDPATAPLREIIEIAACFQATANGRGHATVRRVCSVGCASACGMEPD